MKLLAFLLAIIFFSCNNSTETTHTEIKDTTIAAPQTTITPNRLAGCYLAVKGRDTIRLQLAIKDSLVTGQMQYDNFEIDGNIGTVEGVVRNGRISGYFTFLAEGMWSVREVVFEERDGQLLQASTSNMTYRTDTARFQGNISFDTQRPFTSIACPELRFPQLPAKNL
jgi:hypothetical protein